MLVRLFAPLFLLAATALPAAAENPCSAGIDPVVSLDFGSRYADGDPSRSTLDKTSSQAVTAALKPADTFVRQLARDANAVLERPSAEAADCVTAQIAEWATADALSEMESFNAKLAVGSRLAGIAEAYRQVRPHATPGPAHQAISDWLIRRSRDQIDFWEIEATSGARDGNLRAWATLAIHLSGELAQDDFALMWARASFARIVCTARADGSLPQETKRGSYALHYQFHAIAPLVATAAHAQRMGTPIHALCGDALSRAVDFALTDLDAGGVASQSYSGQPQGFVEKNPEDNAHHFAWLPAYQSLVQDKTAARYLARFDRLLNSKLGGDQSLIWDTGRNTAAAFPRAQAAPSSTAQKIFGTAFP